MAKTDFQSVDAYLASQPPEAAAVLARVRAAIRKALPAATERISYQIPVYELAEEMVLYFAGHKAHYAIYPASPLVQRELAKELEGRVQSKASIHFAYDEVPVRLIARIAKLRAGEAAERAEERAMRKKAKRAAAKKR